MFDVFFAVNEYKKIRNGGVGKLSRAQITDMVILMSKAKGKLPADQVSRAYKVYNALAKDTKKMLLDADIFMQEEMLIVLRFDMEANVKAILSSPEMADFWKDSEEKEKLRNEISATRDSIASATALLEEMRKFEANYKNISDDLIREAAEKGKITRQKAESIIKKKQYTGGFIQAETEELRQTIEKYYKKQKEFYVLACELNKMPELLMKPGIIEDLLKIEV